MTTRDKFVAQLLDAMKDPEVSAQVWESIRIVQRDKEMARNVEWVDKRRAEYAALSYWERIFTPKPL